MASRRPRRRASLAVEASSVWSRSSVEVLSRPAAHFCVVPSALMPRMPEIVASYSAPKRSLVMGTYAEYGVTRVADGQNKIFLTGFVTNQLGQWQLDSM